MTAMEIKTLNVSQETQNELRTPFVWQRPRSRLYDYHNEIGGLYYQPMIKYIHERQEGASRYMVECPDRLQTNFDRIVYRRRQEPEDIEAFLTQYYARRLKDVNSKTVHCKSELMRWSKNPESLNMVRGSANIRDKYLCQIQLDHTAKQAREARMRRERGGSIEEELEEEILAFDEEKVDLDKYEPGYDKIDIKNRAEARKEREAIKKAVYEINMETLKKEAEILSRKSGRELIQEHEGHEESGERKVTTKSFKTVIVDGEVVVDSSSSSSSQEVKRGDFRDPLLDVDKDLLIRMAKRKELSRQDFDSRVLTMDERKNVGRFELAMKRADIFSGGKLPRKQFHLIPIGAKF